MQFNIGPLVMNVSCPGHLIDLLESRYLAFAATSRPNINVEIQVKPDLFGGPLRPVWTEWTDNSLLATSYNFEFGYLDGQVRISVSDDWRAVDAALRILSSALLLEQGILILHASAVLRDGKAYVFCGPSDSGKTTLGSMETIGSGGSDELVCVWPNRAGLVVLDTPFWNRKPNGFNSAYAKGLFFIRQDKTTYLRRMSAKEIVLEAWRNAFFDPEDQRQSKQALKVCAALAKNQAHYLHFQLDEAEVRSCLESI